jgi:hypothetical protein
MARPRRAADKSGPAFMSARAAGCQWARVLLRADSEHGAAERSAAERNDPGASQTPGSCKNQSSSRLADKPAAHIGQQGPGKGAFAYPRELECRAPVAHRSRLASRQTRDSRLGARHPRRDRPVRPDQEGGPTIGPSPTRSRDATRRHDESDRADRWQPDARVWAQAEVRRRGS